MTDKTEKTVDAGQGRSWREKNAPFIYGIAVFTLLILFSVLHSLAIH